MSFLWTNWTKTSDTHAFWRLLVLMFSCASLDWHGGWLVTWRSVHFSGMDESALPVGAVWEIKTSQALGWGNKVFSVWLKTWRTKENMLEEKQRPKIWDYKCVLAKDWHSRCVMGMGPRWLDCSRHCWTALSQGGRTAKALRQEQRARRKLVCGAERRRGCGVNCVIHSRVEVTSSAGCIWR